MRVAIVTLKYPVYMHDPHNKKTGRCVANELCTDSTGAHHTIVFNAAGLTNEVAIERIHNRLHDAHITRIEFDDTQSSLRSSNVIR